ncbi:hypothetical protein JAAARDRAFT_36929 [Jaapia argillacea MUCL 33604]|uniref:C2 domain-containing protein n=1 Tax=Jaapia argillacea MUCL 33604 TaxID=933084 RepID=A0A067PMX5_9AGAM|nr:hypothetical protein JAAARDRAFT_36929 [Jaapia argillacea MUCL 33604]
MFYPPTSIPPMQHSPYDSGISSPHIGCSVNLGPYLGLARPRNLQPLLQYPSFTMPHSHYLNITITDFSIETLKAPTGSRTLNSFVVFEVNGHEQQRSSLREGQNPSWDGQSWSLIVGEGQGIKVFVVNRGRALEREIGRMIITYHELMGSVSANRRITRTLEKSTHLSSRGVVKCCISDIRVGAQFGGGGGGSAAQDIPGAYGLVQSHSMSILVPVRLVSRRMEVFPCAFEKISDVHIPLKMACNLMVSTSRLLENQAQHDEQVERLLAAMSQLFEWSRDMTGIRVVLVKDVTKSTAEHALECVKFIHNYADRGLIGHIDSRHHAHLNSLTRKCVEFRDEFMRQVQAALVKAAEGHPGHREGYQDNEVEANSEDEFEDSDVLVVAAASSPIRLPPGIDNVKHGYRPGGNHKPFATWS